MSQMPKPKYTPGQVVLRTYYNVHDNARRVMKDRTGVVTDISIGWEESIDDNGKKEYKYLYEVHWSTGEVEMVYEYHIRPID